MLLRSAFARMLLTTTALSSGILSLSAVAQSLPTGGHAASGAVAIAASGNTMTINQASQSAIVNWNSFSIGTGNTVNIVQPNAASIQLDRVTGMTPSTIAGSLNANGQVYLVNPNGIAITSSGTVNIGGGFVASTLGMSDAEFNGAHQQFTGIGASGSVTNAGAISIGRGGYAALIGGAVNNSGLIAVPMGTVGLGSGEAAALDVSGDGFLQVAIPSNIGGNTALIQQSGKIKANGGTVILSAATAVGAARNAVAMSGSINAQSISGHNGAIVIGGGLGGAVTISGKLDVSGRKHAKGGAVTVSGQTIALKGAKVNASGATGGGTVTIGGNLHGAGSLQQAQSVTMDAASSIHADATDSGNGGQVVLWSTGSTQAAGLITARGGSRGGNGGMVETSGERLDFTGLTVKAGAPLGFAGTWLLDPQDLTISTMDAATISADLASENIVLSTTGATPTSSDGTGTASGTTGNIFVNGPISWTSSNSLTLTAANNITVSAPISLSAGTFNLTASSATGSGAIAIDAPVTVSGAGTVNLIAGYNNSIPVYNNTTSAPNYSLLNLGFSLAGSISFGTTNNGAQLNIADNIGTMQNYSLLYTASALGGIANSPSGYYALATSLNSGTTYSAALVASTGNSSLPAPFTGTFEGLGNTITNFTISSSTADHYYIGLFGYSTGTIRDTGLANVKISVGMGAESVGGLVGYNTGILANDFVTGTVTVGDNASQIGGLVGFTNGLVTQSFSSTAVSSGSGSTYGGNIGGLAGYNGNSATIMLSYATGGVTTPAAVRDIGGLVGFNGGLIDQTYATGAVTAGSINDSGAGLVGYNAAGSVVSNSYSTGLVSPGTGSDGLDAFAANNAGTLTNDYYDSSTSGQTGGVGITAGGTGTVTALTTAQLQGTTSISLGGGFTGGATGGSSGLFPYLINNNAVITVTPSSQSATYGTAYTLKTTDITASGALAGDTISAALTLPGGAGATTGTTAAGTYAITAGPPSSALGIPYILTASTPGTLTVGQAPLTITALSQSATYGTASTLAVGYGSGYSVTGILNSDSISNVTLAASGTGTSTGTLATTNAGTYTITPSAATGSGLSNYLITYTAGTLSVGKELLIITSANQTATYGTPYALNTAATTGYTEVGLAAGDTIAGLTENVTLSGSAATTTGANTAVGTYAITPSAVLGVSTSNYNILYHNTGTLTIDKAALTISALPQSANYGAAYTLQTTLGNGYSETGLAGTDTISNVTISAFLTGRSAGTLSTTAAGGYTVSASSAAGTGLSNYNITYQSASLTVAKANLTITALAQAATYGTAYTLKTIYPTDYSVSGLITGDSISSLTLAAAGTGNAVGTTTTTSAGAYTITPSAASGAGSSNYNITYVTGLLTVNPAALTITAAAQSATYGTAYTLRTGLGTGFTESGLLNSDSVSSATIAASGTGVASGTTASTNAGPYSLTASGATGTGLSNYNITYSGGNLTVGKAALTITAASQASTYGNAYTLNTALTTGYTETGLASADAITGLSEKITVSGSPMSSTATNTAAGTYTITPSSVAGINPSNYNITYDTGSLTIAKADLTITAAAQSANYGTTYTLQKTLTAGYTETGLVSGDAITGLTVTASGTGLTTGTLATTAVGNYGIAASAAAGTGLSNYNISYTAGTLTVAPASLTITAANQSATYGTAYTLQTGLGAGYTETGLVNSDSISGLTLAASGTGNTSGTLATTNAGAYTITATGASGSGLSNYNITYDTGVLTVNPRVLTNVTYSVANATSTYGTTAILGAVTLGGVLSADSGNVTGEAGAFTGGGSPVTLAYNTAAGSYVEKVTALTGSAASNYTVASTGDTNGTLTIKPLAVRLTGGKTYDGSATGPAASNLTIANLVEGDSAASVGLTGTSVMTSKNVVTSGTEALASTAGALSGLAISNSNYTITGGSGAITVTPASLVVTAANQSSTYGAAYTLNTALTTGYTETGLASGDSISGLSEKITTGGSAVSATAINTAAGLYTITPSAVTGITAANYTITYNTGTLTVAPAALTINAVAQSSTYGTAYALQTGAGTGYTETGLINGDTLSSVTIASSGTGAASGTLATTNAGAYVLTASGAAGTGLSNYNISYNTSTLTVGKAALTIAAAAQSSTYGTAYTLQTGLGAGYTETGLLNSDTIGNVTLAASGTGSSAGSLATTNAGPYTIAASAATGTGLSNYNITYQAGTLNIAKANLTIGAVAQTAIYGTAYTLQNGLTTGFSETGLVNNDSISGLTLLASGTGNTAGTLATTNAGNYTITASNAAGSGLSNYNISYTTGTLTVNPLGLTSITYSVGNATSTYGTTAVLGAASLTGVLSADLNSVNATVGAFTSGGAQISVAYNTAAGTYVEKVTGLTGLAASNYTIAATGDTTGTLIIKPLAVQLAGSMTYNGLTAGPSASNLTITNLVAGDTTSSVGLSGTSLLASKNVVNSGSEPLVSSGGALTGLSVSDPNYTVTGGSGAVTVTPASITVTAANQSSTYGTAYTLQTASDTGYGAAGLYGGDSISSVSLTASGTGTNSGSLGTTNAGAYTIIAANASGAGLSNYTINYESGTLTVGKAALSIAAANQSSTYGTAYNLQTGFGSGYTETGLVNGDNISSLVLTASGTGNSAGTSSTTGAGAYAIAASSAAGMGLSNYTISYQAGTMTVGKAALTIAAAGQSSTYGTAYSLQTGLGTGYTESGLVNGDNVAGVTLTASGTGTNTGSLSTTNAGAYAILASAASGTGLSNYNISYVSSALSVGKAALTIAAADQSKIYGATSLGTTAFTDTGLVNSDTISGVTLSSAGSVATAAAGSGPYAITASAAQGTGLSNYNISYANGGLLTVVARPVTITANNQNSAPNAVLALLTYNVGGFGLVNGDVLSGALTTNATPSSPAGSYAILQGTLTASNNYIVTYVPGTYSIESPAPAGFYASTLVNASKSFLNPNGVPTALPLATSWNGNGIFGISSQAFQSYSDPHFDYIVVDRILISAAGQSGAPSGVPVQ